MVILIILNYNAFNTDTLWKVVMAKLTFLLINPENIAFMQKVAEFNNGRVEQGILTISVIAPKLVIKREWAEEIFKWKDTDTDSKWRSLILNHSGKVLRHSDNEILISD
jgi:hypothetical protein